MKADHPVSVVFFAIKGTYNLDTDAYDLQDGCIHLREKPARPNKLTGFGRDSATIWTTPTKPNIRSVSQCFGLYWYWGHIWRGPGSKSEPIAMSCAGFWTLQMRRAGLGNAAYVYLSSNLMSCTEPASIIKLQNHFHHPRPMSGYNLIERSASDPFSRQLTSLFEHRVTIIHRIALDSWLTLLPLMQRYRKTFQDRYM